jgi:hypothetical protein
MSFGFLSIEAFVARSDSVSFQSLSFAPILDPTRIWKMRLAVVDCAERSLPNWRLDRWSLASTPRLDMAHTFPFAIIERVLNGRGEFLFILMGEERT